MFLKIDLTTKVVERLVVRHLSEVPGVSNNGQHPQLKGFALVEVRMPNMEMHFFHADTASTSGHIDVIYRPRRHDGEYGVDIERYSHGMPIAFSDEWNFKHCWPSGQWHLLMTIDLVEQFLEQEIGYQPQLREYVGHTFQATPPKVANPAAETAAA